MGSNTITTTPPVASLAAAMPRTERPRMLELFNAITPTSALTVPTTANLAAAAHNGGVYRRLNAGLNALANRVPSNVHIGLGATRTERCSVNGDQDMTVPFAAFTYSGLASNRSALIVGELTLHRTVGLNIMEWSLVAPLTPIVVSTGNDDLSVFTLVAGGSAHQRAHNVMFQLFQRWLLAKFWVAQ